MTTTTHHRRGQTWQNRDWRALLPCSGDLNDRARAALAKMRAAQRSRGAVPSPGDPHAMARMVAPFTGDGVPAGGPFVIRPEFRGFA